MSEPTIPLKKTHLKKSEQKDKEEKSTLGDIDKQIKNVKNEKFVKTPIEDIKGAPSLIIVGMQKTGKSSLLNCLIGHPISTTKSSFCTKCAIEYDLIYEEDKELWSYKINGDEVQSMEEILLKLTTIMDSLPDVDCTVYTKVQIIGPVPVTMRVIDTPGFVTPTPDNPDQLIESRNQGIINILLGLTDEMGSYFVVVGECSMDSETSSDISTVCGLLERSKVATRARIIVQNKFDVRLSQWPDGILDKFINKLPDVYYCSSNWGNIIRDSTPIAEQKMLYQRMSSYENGKLSELKNRFSQQIFIKIGLESIYSKMMKMFEQVIKEKRSKIIKELQSRKDKLIKKQKLFQGSKNSKNPFYDLICTLTDLAENVITYHTLIIINNKAAMDGIRERILNSCVTQDYKLNNASFGNKLYWDTYKLLKIKVDEMTSQVISEEQAAQVVETALFDGRSPEQIIEATIRLYFGDVEDLVEKHAHLLSDLVLLQIKYVVEQNGSMLFPDSIMISFECLVNEIKDKILLDLHQDIINKKNTLNMKEEKGTIVKPLDPNHPDYIKYYLEQAKIKMKRLTDEFLDVYIHIIQTQLIRIFLKENKDLFIKMVSKFINFEVFMDELNKNMMNANRQEETINLEIKEIEDCIIRYSR